jgi:iron uptake system component EfeO
MYKKAKPGASYLLLMGLLAGLLVACGDPTATSVPPTTVATTTTTTSAATTAATTAVATTAATTAAPTTVTTTVAATTAAATTAATNTTAAGTTSAAITTATAAEVDAFNAKQLADFKAWGAGLTATSDALKKNDIATAKASFTKLKDTWDDVESAVKNRSKEAYQAFEEALDKVDRALVRATNPTVADVTPLVATLQTRFDEAVKLIQSVKLAPPAPTISGPEVDAAAAKVSDYMKSNADTLVKNTGEFVKAIKSRDITKAKATYEAARSYYESIEFLAEAFPDFDAAIDARPDDFPQGEKDPTWTGFHPLEKAIYADGKLDDNTDKLADKLLTDITALRDEISKLKIDPAQAIAGAGELIEEIQAGKITGEEERYSHTDFNDFKANLASAKFIFETYSPFIKQRNSTLESDLRDNFSSVEKSIAPFFNAQGVATDYSKVDDTTRKVLAQKVEALADSYSKVAGTLGLKI